MSYLRKVHKTSYQLCEKYFDSRVSKWRERVIKSLGKIPKKHAEKILQTYETNQALQAFDIKQFSTLLLSNAINDYIRYCQVKRLTKDHIRVKKSYLNNLLAFTKDVPVSSFERKHYEDYRYHIMRIKKLSYYSHNLMLRHFKSFFNYLVRNDMLYKNPLAKVEKVREIEYPPNIPDERQVQAMIDVAPLHLKYIIIVLIYAGLRINELFNLKFSNIDFENNILIITPDRETGFTTKNKKTRRIPIHPTLRDKLLFLETNWISPHFSDVYPRQPHQQTYVFCKKDGSKFNSIKTTWIKLRNRVGLPNMKVHHFRHYACSVMHKYTHDINFVKEVLGHSDLKVTMRYCHTWNEYRQQQILKLPSLF